MNNDSFLCKCVVVVVPQLSLCFVCLLSIYKDFQLHVLLAHFAIQLPLLEHYFLCTLHTKQVSQSFQIRTRYFFKAITGIKSRFIERLSSYNCGCQSLKVLDNTKNALTAFTFVPGDFLEIFILFCMLHFNA